MMHIILILQDLGLHYKQLSYFKTKNNRIIVVTPGMVELGLKHDLLHEEIGKDVAIIADYVLVISPSRIPHSLQGCKPL